ncbi:MAG TPA: integrase family protein, partial [Novosphingobium sp.]|nr:integrase family protein [Novosphingobium sp.]
MTRPGMAKACPTRRHTIGRHGNLTPLQARARAKELAAMVAQGIDPGQLEKDRFTAADNARRAAEEKARAESLLAFDRLAETWLDHYENEKERRPSGVALAKLVVNRYLVPALGNRPMPHIGRSDLNPILDSIPTAKRGMRRAVFAYGSILFGWAHKRGDIAENPFLSMVKPEAPKARDRVLNDDELAAIWKATATLSEPFGPFFRLLVLTGQRHREVSDISWTELDPGGALWTIPAGRAKNGAAHLVPLSPAAIAELDALALAQHIKAKAKKPDGAKWPIVGFALTTTGHSPISGISKAKAALDKAITEARKDQGGAIPAWRIHDLRRSLATGFQRLGVRFEVTEATLNHISGAKGGV